jgi:hAT family C-terminal dimerisation region
MASEPVAASTAKKYSREQLRVPKNGSKPWWGHPIFLIAHPAANGSDAYCLDCDTELKYKGSTCNLQRHMDSCHITDAVQIAEQGKGSLKAWLAETEHFRWQLVRWMVLTYQPLSTPDHEAFKGLIASLSPRTTVPTARDVVADLTTLEQLARKHICKVIDSQFCAFTTDAWTSSAVDAYMSIVASFIDESFKLVVLPLECAPFSGSHTAENILSTIQQLAERNGMSEDFISAMVADNAANQKKAGELASFESLPCAPHTLQLTVKLILEDEDFKDVLAEARKVVKAFKHSALKGEELREEQKRLGLKLQRLLQDVRTRWSSTYLMLKTMCANRHAIDIVCTRHAAVHSAAKKTAATSVAKATSTAAANGVSTTAASLATTPASGSSGTAVVTTGTTSVPVAPTVAAALGARTRIRSGILADKLGALAEDELEQMYSSSDDGSVDLGFPRGSDMHSDTAIAPIEVLSADSDGDNGHDSERSSSSGQHSSGNSGASDFESGAARKRKRPTKTSSSSHSSKAVNSSNSSSAKRSSSTGIANTKRGRGSSRGGKGGKGKSAKKHMPTAAEVVAEAAAAAAAKAAKVAKKQKKQRKGQRVMPKLTDAQWDSLELLCDLLEPIYEAQTALEGEKYITRSMLPYYITKIRDEWTSTTLCDNDALAGAATRLLDDFNERWPANEWPMATQMAVALDPRTKYMSNFSKAQRDATWRALAVEMKALHKLLLEHNRTKAAAAAASSISSVTEPDAAATRGSASSVTLSAAITAAASAGAGRFEQTNPDADGNSGDEHDITSDYDDKLLQERIDNELRVYRKENALPDVKDADPFLWWRKRLQTYPLLAVVARKWLAVPASSAASERMFSAAGLTVTKDRSRLTTDHVGTLVFLKTAWPALQAEGVLYSATARVTAASLTSDKK